MLQPMMRRSAPDFSSSLRLGEVILKLMCPEGCRLIKGRCRRRVKHGSGTFSA